MKITLNENSSFEILSTVANGKTMICIAPDSSYVSIGDYVEFAADGVKTLARVFMSDRYGDLERLKEIADILGVKPESIPVITSFYDRRKCKWEEEKA